MSSYKTNPAHIVLHFSFPSYFLICSLLTDDENVRDVKYKGRFLWFLSWIVLQSLNPLNYKISLD